MSSPNERKSSQTAETQMYDWLEEEVLRPRQRRRSAYCTALGTALGTPSYGCRKRDQRANRKDKSSSLRPLGASTIAMLLSISVSFGARSIYSAYCTISLAYNDLSCDYLLGSLLASIALGIPKTPFRIQQF